jgi:sugar phosphate isomerase/epimerase
MLLAISNLAWSVRDSNKVLAYLAKNNINLIEVAPTKISDWSTVNSEIDNFYKMVNLYNIKVYSFQSLFYKTPIQDLSDMNGVISHIETLIKYAKKIGVKVLVLGSPKLRNYIFNYNILLDQLEALFVKNNMYLCIEPNAQIYGGKYFFTVDEIVDSIKNYSNIKTMIDTHNSVLANTDPIEEFKKYQEYVYHIHVSEIGLKPIDNISFHKNFAETLKNLLYNKVITYELLEHNNLENNISIFSKIYDSK